MKLIVANWKQHPETVEQAVKLAKASDQKNLVICPPFNYLKEISKVLRASPLGAQDYPASWRAGLKKLGAKYAIIGHSDRRKAGDTNEIVAEKFSSAIANEVIPVLCVGETFEQKRKGLKNRIIKEEITSAFEQSQLKAKSYKLKVIYIAYEPIWAISTNPNAEPDKPKNTLETVVFIKSILKAINSKLEVRYLYGGSVNSGNAESFLKHPEIEGALVGGASLKPEEINKIVETAEQYGKFDI